MSIKIGPEAYPYLLVIAIVFAVIVLLIILSVKSSQKKAAVKAEYVNFLQEEGIDFQYRLAIFSGLNLPENTGCMVSSGMDGISIEANGSKYILKKEKILDVCIKTDVEIQKQYVSSVGGAVTGAVLFGPIGAMIGGRAKQKVDRTINNYLIFTYDKDGIPDYLAFNITGQSGIGKRFADEYKNVNNASVVEL